jgi:hypothetical protein
VGSRYSFDHPPIGSVELVVFAEVCPSASTACRFVELVKTVTLNAGTTTLNLVLALPGSIAGRVTTKESGAAVADEEVQVCDVVGTTTCRNYFNFDVTGADGTYLINGLQAGKYVVTVRGQTRTVTVAASTPLTGINFVVPKGVTVNGRVTTSVSAPLGTGVFVTAYSTATGEIVGSAQIGVDGKYSLTKLPAGGLTICVEEFDPLGFGRVFVECWNNSASLLGATPMPGAVSGAVINGINFVLGGPYAVRNLKAAVPPMAGSCSRGRRPIQVARESPITSSSTPPPAGRGGRSSTAFRRPHGPPRSRD